MLNIKKNEDLKKYSTFRVGGKARYFVEISSEEEFKEALDWALKNEQKIFVLGGGSNIIFSDNGFQGLIVKLKKGKLEKENEKLFSWAGNSLIGVINFSKEQELAGIENLAGIPGTIGGAVFGNAGAFGTEIGDLVEKVVVFDLKKQKKMNFSKKDCVFSYRNSIFKDNSSYIVLSVNLKLKKNQKEEIEKKIREINEKRGNKQPKDWVGSVGSFFKNPETQDQELIKEFEKEKETKVKDGKVPAGWLIDKVGLLEKQIGGVKISKENGNFITNVGNAKAQDVVTMISFIKQQVRGKFNIELQEEVCLIGF